MSEDLEERLLSHQSAFDSLLELIPASDYYGKNNTTDQWNKKKQTKEEAVLAKKRKLDPEGDRSKTAKDGPVEHDDDGSDEGLLDGEEKVVVVSKKQLKRLKKEMKGDIATGPPPSKKQKKSAPEPPKTEKTGDDSEQKTPATQTPKKEKAKKEAKKPATPKTDDKPMEDGAETPAKAAPKTKKEKKKAVVAPKEEVAAESDVEMEEDKEDKPVDATASKVADVVVPDADSKEAEEPSTEEPSTEDATKSAEPAKPAPSAAELKARLQAKIDAFKAKRKAGDTNGPALTRSELLAARKEKDAARRKRKLEMRAAAKLADQEGKGSPVGDSKEIISAVAKEEAERASRASSVNSAANGNYTFSSVVFDDGAAVTRTPGQSSTPFAPGTVNKRKKGPSDAYTALQKISAKKSRIENMPEEKKAAIEEKETWAKAVKHAAGEKVRDDEKLLKKTLKRQEKQKKKSTKEWGDRKEGVQKSQDARIKKREENIAHRIEMKKAGKGSKKQKAAAAKKKTGTKFKGKSRPGFEGGSGKVKPTGKTGGNGKK
ncbi:SURF6-domain-containing protein [Ascobolus immersus RN42]|uniref:SURF6-domain-containing protein n=1 Tax=Ascobolus immersus RN42 TaxID=1160509 RepID=A0A3N4IE11_ASCIM|nr:SURF6-domain-containing protein [Ascobolus immersus RN42]